MKLYSIIINFGKIPMQEEKLGDRVFKKISDFNRKAELISSIITMRELSNAFEEERNAKVMELIQNYCDEQNSINKDKEDYEELKPGENIDFIPESKAAEFKVWYNQKIFTEIKSIEPVKFLPEEIEAADRDAPIDPEALIRFSDFYCPKEMSDYVKQKRNEVATQEILSKSKQDARGPSDDLCR